MKSQLGESTTAGWMCQVPLCPDLHLGPVTAPSLQPHVNGTCCDCCWCQSWQGPVQSAGLQSLAPFHSGISHLQQSWRPQWWRWVGTYVGNWVSLWLVGGWCFHLVTSPSPIPEQSLTMSWVCFSSWLCEEWLVPDRLQWFHLCWAVAFSVCPTHIIWVILVDADTRWGLGHSETTSGTG